MIKRGSRLGFALETFQRLAILGQRLGQELERDEPAQAGVFGFEDHTHAAGAPTAQGYGSEKRFALSLLRNSKLAPVSSQGTGRHND
jgi:hypothetical protein